MDLESQQRTNAHLQSSPCLIKSDKAEIHKWATRNWNFSKKKWKSVNLLATNLLLCFHLTWNNAYEQTVQSRRSNDMQSRFSESQLSFSLRNSRSKSCYSTEITAKTMWMYHSIHERYKTFHWSCFSTTMKNFPMPCENAKYMFFTISVFEKAQKWSLLYPPLRMHQPRSIKV